MIVCSLFLSEATLEVFPLAIVQLPLTSSPASFSTTYRIEWHHGRCDELDCHSVLQVPYSSRYMRDLVPMNRQTNEEGVI